MISNDLDPQNDALIMIHLRNTFYKKKLYFALFILILTLTITGFLMGILVYLIKHPIYPLYFITDDIGRLTKDIPRHMPNMSTDEVKQWVIEAIENAYSYDFVNYPKQFQNTQKYYTDYGWRKYMEGLTASNNLLALKQRHYVVIAKVSGEPILLNEGLLAGAYAWKFKMPLLITYMEPPYNETTQFQNAYYESVIVQRQSLLTSYKGLGIVQATQEAAT